MFGHDYLLAEDKRMQANECVLEHIALKFLGVPRVSVGANLQFNLRS